MKALITHMGGCPAPVAASVVSPRAREEHACCLARQRIITFLGTQSLPVSSMRPSYCKLKDPHGGPVIRRSSEKKLCAHVRFGFCDSIHVKLGQADVVIAFKEHPCRLAW